MIDIQKGPLRPFEQYTFAIISQVLENCVTSAVTGMTVSAACMASSSALAKSTGSAAEIFCQQEIVIIENLAKFLCKFFAHEKI